MKRSSAAAFRSGNPSVIKTGASGVTGRTTLAVPWATERGRTYGALLDGAGTLPEPTILERFEAHDQVGKAVVKVRTAASATVNRAGDEVTKGAPLDGE